MVNTVGVNLIQTAVSLQVILILIIIIIMKSLCKSSVMVYIRLQDYS